MGKGKSAPAERHAGVGMEAKRNMRAAQSARDSAAARAADGWVPSKRTKELVEMKHRCPKCLNPSALCRRGLSHCVRCGGSAQRSRSRQLTRSGGGKAQVVEASHE